MKKRNNHCGTIILCLVLFGCNSGKELEGGNETALRDLLQKQQTAWNKGDIAGFMEGYAKEKDLQFIGSRGVLRGWQSTLDSYREHYPNKEKMGRLDFSVDTVEFLDVNRAIGHINGKWKLYRSADTPNGHFSLITRQTHSGPKIIIDHTW